MGLPDARTILRNLTPSCPLPSQLQLRLAFNLHNLPHLEGLGGGENGGGGVWEQRPDERFCKHPEESRERGRERQRLGQAQSRLQTTDNILPSTAGVNLVHLPSDKKRKKKVGCNFRILRLPSEGLVWRWEEGGTAKEEREAQEGARKCLSRGWGRWREACRSQASSSRVLGAAAAAARSAGHLRPCRLASPRLPAGAQGAWLSPVPRGGTPADLCAPQHGRRWRVRRLLWGGQPV